MLENKRYYDFTEDYDRIFLPVHGTGKSKQHYIPKNLTNQEIKTLKRTILKESGWSAAEIRLILKSKRFHSKLKSNNTSGYTGVCPYVDSKTSYGYIARFMLNKKVSASSFVVSHCEKDAYIKACKFIDQSKGLPIKEDLEYLATYTPINWSHLITKKFKIEVEELTVRNILALYKNKPYRLSLSVTEVKDGIFISTQGALKAARRNKTTESTIKTLYLGNKSIELLKLLLTPLFEKVANKVGFSFKQQEVEWENIEKYINNKIDVDAQNARAIKAFSDSLSLNHNSLYVWLKSNGNTSQKLARTDLTKRNVNKVINSLFDLYIKQTLLKNKQDKTGTTYNLTLPHSALSPLTDDVIFRFKEMLPTKKTSIIKPKAPLMVIPKSPPKEKREISINFISFIRDNTESNLFKHTNSWRIHHTIATKTYKGKIYKSGAYFHYDCPTLNIQIKLKHYTLEKTLKTIDSKVFDALLPLVKEKPHMYGCK